MIIELDESLTPFLVIGAVNRALGDTWESRRHYSKIFGHLWSEKAEIFVHEESKEKCSNPGNIVYSISFVFPKEDFQQDPMYVKKTRFEIDGIDESLLEKILQELKGFSSV